MPLQNTALRKAQSAIPREAGAWGIYRDGELYSVEKARWIADEHVAELKPGSKHEWRISRVRVTPIVRP